MANENPDPRDARIKELEAQLLSVEKTHAFQAERADKLEADLKTANEKHEFQRKRASKLETQLSAEKKVTAPLSPDGGEVVFRGQAYRIIGDFRADNTFVEVKRGHCPEGVTLIAIDRPH